MHRECIPFPGPPEENELALPNNTRRIPNSSICGLFELTDGNATANSNIPLSFTKQPSPP